MRGSSMPGSAGGDDVRLNSDPDAGTANSTASLLPKIIVFNKTRIVTECAW